MSLQGLGATAVAGSMDVGVMTTNNRGLNADELADMLLNKVFYVSQDAPPSVMEQAREYRDKLRVLFVHYLTQAQTNQNVSIYNILMQAGQTSAAEIVRSL